MKSLQLKIVFIIDESGSMHGTEQDIIGGFNRYVEDQKNEQVGDVNVSLYKFSNQSNLVYDSLSIARVEPLNENQYRPQGSTALFDALGRAITETDNSIRMQDPKDRPSKVVVVVMTDGEENASTHYLSKTVRELIAARTEIDHWSFVFIGADLESFSDSESLGIRHSAFVGKNDLSSFFQEVSEMSSDLRSFHNFDEKIMEDRVVQMMRKVTIKEK